MRPHQHLLGTTARDEARRPTLLTAAVTDRPTQRAQGATFAAMHTAEIFGGCCFSHCTLCKIVQRWGRGDYNHPPYTRTIELRWRFIFHLLWGNDAFLPSHGGVMRKSTSQKMFKLVIAKYIRKVYYCHFKMISLSLLDWTTFY